MSTKVFVDCDDTLVIYENYNVINPYGYYMGEPWKPNLPLIQAIYQNAWNIGVYVWSGGGRDYANMWGRKFFPTDVLWTPLDKDTSTLKLVRKGDIVIDDQILEVEGTLFFPDDLSWVGAI
jgi:hypothetical protein